MIDSLKIKNFTVFKNAEFEFSPGLNVIIGENGSGKSHLLKLIYTMSRVLHDEQDSLSKGFDFPNLSFTLSDRLFKTFLPDKIESLIRRGNGKIAEISARLGKRILNYHLGSDKQHCDGTMAHETPKYPIFIPPKEVLAIYYGFTALYEKREVSFDMTFNDLCNSVGLPVLREKHLTEVKALFSELEKAIGGQIIIENGRVYLKPFDKPKMEINLVAEGWRKIGLFALLIRNGSIQPGYTLLWDEPEANLNPQLEQLVAKTLVGMVKRKAHVFLVSHSLFLLKEIELLLEKEPFPIKFFNLRLKNGCTSFEEGSRLSELKNILSLDEALKQDDREQDAFWKK